MAANDTPRHPGERQGLAAGVLTGLAKALFWLLFALLFSIVIEWVGMMFWWPDQRTQHSQSMLEQELEYLNSDFRQSLLASDTVAYAQRYRDIAYTVLFEWTRLDEVFTWLNAPSRPNDPQLMTRLRLGYRTLVDFVIAAITISQVFAVRLAVLTLAMPAFVLIGIVALVDGLVQRDLRRWGGGRESAFIYHHAKRWLFPALLLAWIIYLGLPFSVHPNVVILPFAGLFALSLTITAATFKKYL
jgi:integrating conjugative element membrane protein (TIGR03747 family)